MRSGGGGIEEGERVWREGEVWKGGMLDCRWREFEGGWRWERRGGGGGIGCDGKGCIL